MGRQSDYLIARGDKQGICADQKRARPLLNSSCKGRLDGALAVSVYDKQAHVKDASCGFHLPRFRPAQAICRIDQQCNRRSASFS
jgi:hypothetical protein